MGADGKTGETLVKSALAPMFKYRNLQVLTWQGYNILGDRDGSVLADAENKKSKVESKDALLQKILGYPLHTHVGIDYVPSLERPEDGLGLHPLPGASWATRCRCSSPGRAATPSSRPPIVIDMLRLADLAQRRGEGGAMRHLSCFFKSPLGVDQHDLHLQWHLLTDYIENARR